MSYRDEQEQSTLEQSEKRMLMEQKKEYYLMFLLNYFYYNILDNRSRKFEMTEIFNYFKWLYDKLQNEEAIKMLCEFDEIAVVPDNQDEFENYIRGIMSDYINSNSFQIRDGSIFLQGAFSWPDNKTLAELKRLFYINRNTAKGCLWRYKYEPEFFENNAASGEYGTVMQNFCESAIDYFKRPVMSPECDNVEIDDKNLELGQLLAARFIYRCGKAWFRDNEKKIGEKLRTPEVILGGLENAVVSGANYIIERYRKDINSKYLELSNRFAFLLQMSGNDTKVFDSHYKGNDAFLIGARKYIVDFVDSPFQKFKVWKNEAGEVYLEDSFIYGLNISNMTKDDRNYYFRGKYILDGMVLSDRIKARNARLFSQFIEDQTAARNACKVGIEVSPDGVGSYQKRLSRNCCK